MIKKLKENLILTIIASAIIYLAFSFFADFDSVLKAFEAFPFPVLFLALILTFCNYLLRFFKWHYYLRKLKIGISFKKSFHIFMAGLIMSITPGKFGEILKSYLVKFETAEPVSKTLPVMIVERITDFYSLLIIALAGAFYFDYGKTVVIIVTFFFVLLTIIINREKLSLKLIALLSKIKFLSKYTKNLETAYESAYTLLKLNPLYEMTLLSVVAWAFECLAFYLIVISFDLGVTLHWAFFIYSFAIIVGSITMLPAGLGITDGSLTYFIYKAAGKMNIAVVTTLLTRLVTLWFAVLIGIFSLYLYQRKNGNIFEITEEKK